ncbi:transferase [Vibrio sp. qd031]|uniref:sugar O-acetyltransferase n=1 Tax=Vibrio sp. qd031 TaxID=1603038 RepID=UPI000A0FD3C6|nr:sugar O-acetyltransferase [Vibrio sp. qd031]ORT50153.1 transferase [Vibrio sp. qd031]
MTFIQQITSDKHCIHQFKRENLHHQHNAKKLCFELSRTHPDDQETKQNIYCALFGNVGTFISIESGFRCDYGFNIHFKGFALINFNTVILDTSPVTIGHGVLIGPGSVLSCVGHAIDPEQRVEGGLYESSPITLEDRVWLGANTTLCSGVTIGEGTIIGAGSVVTKDIPAGVVAVGNPCRVVREITEQDKWHYTEELELNTPNNLCD